MYLRNSVTLMETVGELAIALCKTGDTKGANQQIDVILKNSTVFYLNTRVLRILERIEQFLGGRISLGRLQTLVDCVSEREEATIAVKLEFLDVITRNLEFEVYLSKQKEDDRAKEKLVRVTEMVVDELNLLIGESEGKEDRNHLTRLLIRLSREEVYYRIVKPDLFRRAVGCLVRE